MADYGKPEDLIGEHGLLKQPTKLLIEKALRVEIADAVIKEIKGWQSLTLSWD